MNKYLATAVVLTAAFSFGCKDKSRPADLPADMEPCAIEIIQDGAPLAGADVFLVATDPDNQKYTSSAATDETGVAKIKTYGYEGVHPGHYKVCVSKIVTEGQETTTGDDGEETTSTGEDFFVVDLQYKDAETTPLEIDVVKKMKKTTFDVGESVREPKK